MKEAVDRKTIENETCEGRRDFIDWENGKNEGLQVVRKRRKFSGSGEIGILA